MNIEYSFGGKILRDDCALGKRKPKCNYLFQNVKIINFT